MTSIPKAVFLALSMLISSVAAVAQGSAPDQKLRARAFGEVRDLAGKPWVKAKVTLISQPATILDSADSADVVEAVTDERGRFRAAVLRHRLYSAWAVADAGKGLVRVTKIEENVTTGVPARLQEARWRTASATVEIAGLDGWADRMPVRVHVLGEAQNKWCRPLELDEKNTVVLPPMPGRSCTIEIFGKGGGILFSKRMPVSRTDEARRVNLGEKQEFFVEVRGTETGKGLPDATIYRSVRGHFHPIGKTEKDGVAKLVLPVLPPAQMMFVGAKGRAIGQVRRGRMRRASGGKILRENVRISAHANLQSGEVFTGQIRFGGVPAKNLALLHRGRSFSFDQRAQLVNQYQRVIRTDGEGRFVIDGCAKGTTGATSICAALTSRDILQLPEAWHRQVNSSVNAVVDLAAAGPGATRSLPPVDLTRFCPVMLEVTDHTGLPAKGVDVSIGSRDMMSDHFLVGGRDYVTDRAGRVCMLVRPSDEMAMALRGRGSFLVKRMHVRSKIDDYSLAFLRVKLEKPWSISGTVVNKKDKPVSNLQLRCHMFWENAIAQDDDAEKPRLEGTGNGVALGELDRATFTNCISTFVANVNTAKTNKKGEFRMVVPAIPMKWYLYGAKSFLFISQRVNATVEVKDGPVKDLKLTIQ